MTMAAKILQSELEPKAKFDFT